MAKKKTQPKAVPPTMGARLLAFFRAVEGKSKGLRYRDRALSKKRYRTKDSKADE